MHAILHVCTSLHVVIAQRSAAPSSPSTRTGCTPLPQCPATVCNASSRNPAPSRFQMRPGGHIIICSHSPRGTIHTTAAVFSKEKQMTGNILPQTHKATLQHLTTPQVCTQLAQAYPLAAVVCTAHSRWSTQTTLLVPPPSNLQRHTAAMYTHPHLVVTTRRH